MGGEKIYIYYWVHEARQKHGLIVTEMLWKNASISKMCQYENNLEEKGSLKAMELSWKNCFETIWGIIKAIHYVNNTT